MMEKRGGKLFDRIKEVVQRMSAPRGLSKLEPEYEPGVPGEPPPEEAPRWLQEMSLDDWSSQAGIIGTLRQAAKQRTLVELTYNGTPRYVEVYSFRNGKYGVLLYGYCLVHNSIHSFYIWRIDDAKLTDIPFSPRWTVEL